MQHAARNREGVPTYLLVEVHMPQPWHAHLGHDTHKPPKPELVTAEQQRHHLTATVLDTGLKSRTPYSDAHSIQVSQRQQGIAAERRPPSPPGESGCSCSEPPEAFLLLHHCILA
jgi:hypothetical protein